MSDFWQGYFLGAFVASCAAAILFSCSSAPVIMPPASMQVWTDAEGQPDPLAECRRVGGPCVVATAEAWGYWTTRWSECEIALEECEEEAP
jgi:hypothetical protein